MANLYQEPSGQVRTRCWGWTFGTSGPTACHRIRPRRVGEPERLGVRRTDHLAVPFEGVDATAAHDGQHRVDRATEDVQKNRRIVRLPMTVPSLRRPGTL
jgi:hypothetical protein